METLMLCICLASLASLCESANILYVVPFTSRSHYIMLRPLGLELARRGHNVTVITGFKEDDHPTNYRQVMVDNIQIWEVIGGKRPNVFDMVQIEAEKFHEMILWNGGVGFTEVALNSTQVKQFLAEDNTFDLVISEQFFQEALYLLAHKYKAPLALITTFGNCMRHNVITRNPLQLATTTAEFLDVKDPTSFWGRFRNLYFSVYEFFWWKFRYLERQEQLARKYLKDLPKPIPTLYEMQRNSSLILLNSHFSFDPPTAYLPNAVEIGGLHLSKSENKLPDDLQNIIDEAKHGVIYVNFGSNVRSSELPLVKKNAFLNVFRKLKQTVIWKWEDDILENKPKNLVVRKWLPQKEILAHPNIKVFISHGGLIGTQEAVFNGIPIVGIPIYADQYNNLLQVEQHGIGKILQYNDINEDTLQSVLTEALSNEKYARNAKDLSTRFQDRPMTPLNTAVYWIEYVIKYKGADFLKNPSLNMSWIAYNMLDVYAFLLLMALTSVYFVYRIMLVVKYLLSTLTTAQLHKRKLK